MNISAFDLISSQSITSQMGNSELDLELSSLIRSLTNACLLLYEFYGIEIRVFGLVLIAFFSFKLGTKSVVDPLEEQVKQMRFIMETREHYTIIIPNKIKSLSSRIRVSLIILILGIITYFVLEHLRPQIVHKVDVNIYILVAGLVFLMSVLFWFYQLYLKFKLNRGKFNDHYIMQKLGNIVKMLGSKAEVLLTFSLCKESYKKYKSRSGEGCIKQRCKEYRLLLDEKVKGVSTLIQNTLNFQWCLACKKRMPFDEYLDFQVSQYSGKIEENQEQEVMKKNNYLLKEVDKMAKWVKDVGPCNCSMRYWYESKKEISQFKKREKQIEPKITMLQGMKS